MITAQETLGVDAARTASAVNSVVEINSKINWDIVGPILIVFFILAFFAFWHKDWFVYAFKNNFITRWRGKQRMRAEREKKLREILSDNIQDAIDDALLEGDITPEERQWAFETIGKLGFPDLRTMAMTLKEEIKAKRKEATDQETSLRTVHVL